MSTAPNFSTGNFVPENYVVPEGEEQQREFLKRTLENHARFINRKDMGQYEELEVQNNQTFPGADPQNKNFIFRKIVSTGALPNAGTNTVAHGITGINNNWFFTRIYGTAEEPAGAGSRPFYIPMPNAGPTYQVELMVDNTNINITTVANLSAFTSSFVILEFYKG